MWKKLLITGCMSFCLLSGGILSAQPSCETKEEVTSEQLDRTQKGLVAMMKELKNDSYFQAELDKESGCPFAFCPGDTGRTGMDEAGSDSGSVGYHEEKLRL